MNPAAKTVSVLIVDDNPLIRELMAQALDPLCRVIIAADGADALLKAVDAPPDLIITDFKMPGLDGRQLYEKLRHREATRNTPFIFVASQGDIEEKLRPLVAAEDFLPKPFFVPDLVRRGEEIRGPPAPGKAAAARRASGRDPGAPGGDGRGGTDAISRNGAEVLPPELCGTARRVANYISRPANARTRAWAKSKAIRPFLKRSAGAMANSRSISPRLPTAPTPRVPPRAC